VLLPDVNILVYAHREEAAGHDQHLRWLDALVNGDQAYAMTSVVVSGFLRVVTHPRVFDPPTPMAAALDFASSVREAPQCVPI